MNKDILLITNFWHFEEETSSRRYLTLSQMISDLEGVDLEVITSTFYHETKLQRDSQIIKRADLRYNITLIDEPGYKKNISLKRIFSHKCFAKNVLKYIERRKTPDVIYCVFPTIDLAYNIQKYCIRNNIKFVLDIQDLWPESFRMAVDLPVISDILFFGPQARVNKIFSQLEYLVAVSDTFKEKALKFSPKAKAISTYIGLDISEFDSISNIPETILKKKGDKTWIIYIGSLGHSYDLSRVIRAISMLQTVIKNQLELIVIGDGPNRAKFEEEASQLNINAYFSGKLKYQEMVPYLRASDIAVNPINSKSVASIINKHGDYLASGLPIINTQKSKEFVSLIDKCNAGINCLDDSDVSVSKAIEDLFFDKELRIKLGEGARGAAEQLFDRNVTYREIIDLIMHD